MSYNKYNALTDSYEGELYINENIEDGSWKIDYISLTDKSYNNSYIWNSNTDNYGDIREDLSTGDFNIKGTTADITAPVLDVSSLKVDKKEVTVGDTVKISFKANDDITGIKYAYVYYKMPITGKQEAINMEYNSLTDSYEGELYINENIEDGSWKIDYISLTDKSYNNSYIWNSNTDNYGDIRENLSAGNFIVKPDENTIKPIQNVTVVSRDESWSNKTINGDLYIGPEAVLTINSNVTINGNIYVLGAMKSYGGLTVKGTIYGRSTSFGGSTLYNGTIVLYGSNSIYSLNMSNYPVTDLPIRIDDSPLVANNGKVDLQGATVNVANMYIEGQKVELDYKGRFDVKDIYIGNKDNINIELVTVFGNTIKKSVELDDHINKVPEINANDVVIKVGDTFNAKTGVSASDKEDGSLTSKIVVKEDTVNTSKVGTYKVVYSVTDSDGNTVTKEIKVTVRSNEKPVISASDKALKVGDTFNVKTGVSASDKEDGSLTSKIVVKENTVNTSKVGTYKVVYSVTDSDKNTVTKEIKVTVNNVFTNFTVNNIDSKTTIIKGKGISGSTVKAYVGTKQIGNTVTVNLSGNYSINIPAQSANTKITIEISKSGYETSNKTITVIRIVSGAKKSLTTDIYKYDAGKGNHLTYINGRGYSQYVYLNKSGKYAFTPSSWMVAAGLDVSMPKSSNGYTMTIDNNYIQMYNEANTLLNKIKSGKVAKSSIEDELNKIKNIKNQELEVQNESNVLTKASSKKTLTEDIYKYDIGKGKHLTYVNGKGYSQYVYLNKSGNYAFTPSSWMVAAGLTVTMPTSSNGYTMKIDNPYITKYNDVVKQIKDYI